MRYDFTSLIDRRGKDALAVDWLGAPDSPFPAPKAGFDAIPMWVADMSFATAPSVTEAILKRAKHPCFGYFLPQEEYYQAIINWQKVCHGTEGLMTDDIGYENGVLGGVITALNALCSRGDPVLLHAPAYVGFTGSLEANGYRIVLSPLVPDADGVYRMDYEDMERKIVSKHIHAAVFCSPHNPSGRVWERRELETAMEIFRAHDVAVISDEIWSDIVFRGHRHIPLQSISKDAKKRTVALYSPSKTFNLGGLAGSYHVVYDPWLKDRLRRESSLSRYNEMNVLSMHALMGGYSPEGREWLGELLEVLESNAELAVRTIRERFPGVSATMPEGTYMLFPDCSEWCAKHGKSLDDLLRAGYDVGVFWQDGRPFHGSCHIRMNLALPRSRLQEALDRLDRYVFNP